MNPYPRPNVENIYNGIICPGGLCTNLPCGGNSWQGTGTGNESYLECPVGFTFGNEEEDAPEFKVTNKIKSSTLLAHRPAY